MKRKLSIISGLVLFLFVSLHLISLSVSVVSIELAESLRAPIMFPFMNPVGGILLLISFIVHLSLGLMALYRRNTLQMTRYDLVQFVSALLITPLLIPHVWGLISTINIMGFSPGYADLFQYFWVQAPAQGLRQVLLVVAVWIHGCVGLFTWLQLKPSWPRISPLAYLLAVTIPIMALLGFVEGGNHVLDQSTAAPQLEQPRNGKEQEVNANPAQSEISLKPGSPEFIAARAFIDRVETWLFLGYAGLLALVLLARHLRVRSNHQYIEVHYSDGEIIKRLVGPTLLEISTMNNIPHANLCRGKGRCGTCRVQVISTENELDPASDIEKATLSRTDSADDIRLACQLSPGAGVIHIKRLISPAVQPRNRSQREEIGEQQEATS